MWYKKILEHLDIISSVISVIVKLLVYFLGPILIITLPHGEKIECYGWRAISKRHSLVGINSCYEISTLINNDNEDYFIIRSEYLSLSEITTVSYTVSTFLCIFTLLLYTLRISIPIKWMSIIKKQQIRSIQYILAIVLLIIEYLSLSNVVSSNEKTQSEDAFIGSASTIQPGYYIQIVFTLYTLYITTSD